MTFKFLFKIHQKSDRILSQKKYREKYLKYLEIFLKYFLSLNSLKIENSLAILKSTIAKFIKIIYFKGIRHQNK